jgi:hypothetical protein
MRLRQRADEFDNKETSLGRHITLLWDDADRLPQSLSGVNRLRAPQ